MIKIENKDLPADFPFKLKDDEEIKQIKEYPEYWISNYGRVFSYKKIDNYIQWEKASYNIDERNRVGVRLIDKNKKGKEKRVRRSLPVLIYETFCGNVKNNEWVVYKDGNTFNNYYKNLLLVNRSDRMKSIGINRKPNTYVDLGNNVVEGITSNGDKFLIDKEDLDKVSFYCWHKHKDGYMRTVLSTTRDENGKQHNETILMHNFILGKKEGLELDHLNGNPADNRKCNLQYKTHAENMDNITKYDENNIIRGVYFDKNNKKWKAIIKYNKKQYNLGSFKEYKDAEKAVLDKRKELRLIDRKDRNAEI